jgi:hypothetical protein
VSAACAGSEPISFAVMWRTAVVGRAILRLPVARRNRGCGEYAALSVTSVNEVARDRERCHCISANREDPTEAGPPDDAAAVDDVRGGSVLSRTGGGDVPTGRRLCRGLS